MAAQEHLYREAATRRVVICPTCERPVEVDRDETATCLHCDARFATREATTLVEYNATRNLMHALEKRTPAAGGMTARTRWALTGGVMGTIIAASAVFGFAGFVGAGGIVVGLFLVAGARSGGGELR